jgi:hypothetical protein
MQGHEITKTEKNCSYLFFFKLSLQLMKYFPKMFYLKQHNISLEKWAINFRARQIVL